MLSRLLLGLLKGLIVGGLVAALVVKVVGLLTIGALAAYPLAVIVGVLTGLIAGRPVWSRGARIEAYLKAGAGALLAAGLLFALRQWATVTIPELPFEMGGGAVLGEVPAVVLPLISAVLALLFDLDNTGKDDAEPPPKKQRVAGGSQVRVQEADFDEDILAEIEDDLEKHAERERD